MSNKKVGDRVTSTDINAYPITQITGIIIDIEFNGIGEPVHALVKQDDGQCKWWGL